MINDESSIADHMQGNGDKTVPSLAFHKRAGGITPLCQNKLGNIKQDLSKLISQRQSWTLLELFQPILKLYDTGATICCQPNKNGLLRETIVHIPPLDITGCTGNTCANEAGIRLEFFESAHDKNTCFAICYVSVVIPTLGAQQHVLSPWQFRQQGVRQQCDALGHPPYITVAPRDRNLDNDYQEMRGCPTVLLEKLPAKDLVFLRPVDPRKYSHVRDLCTGGAVDLRTLLRRLKNTGKGTNLERNATNFVLDGFTRIRRSQTIYTADNTVHSQCHPAMRCGAMCCGHLLESIPGAIDANIAKDLTFELLCERDETLKRLILNRLRIQGTHPVYVDKLQDVKHHGTELDFLLFTVPCEGETVLRQQLATYPDSETTQLFRQEHMGQIVLACKRPKVVTAELTSPHPKSFEYHLKAENTMAALGYSQYEGSGVVNAALYGGCVSQPRWIRTWATSEVGDLRLINPRQYETQHPRPISDVIQVDDPNREWIDASFVQVCPEFAISVYRAQHLFSTQGWRKKSLNLSSGMHYSDNAYISSMFAWCGPGVSTLHVGSRGISKNMNLLRNRFLWVLSHNACVRVKAPPCDRYRIIITLDLNAQIQIPDPDAAFVVCFGYYKDGNTIQYGKCTDHFCNPGRIDSNSALDAHQGYRIAVVGLRASQSSHADICKATVDRIEESDPGLVMCSARSPSNYAVWRDIRGQLLYVPLAHFVGHFGSKSVKGQKIYLYTGPIGVITSKNNAHILMPNGRCTILTERECISAKGLDAARHCIQQTARPAKAIANAVTGGLTNFIYRFGHSLVYARDSLRLATEGDEVIDHYTNHAHCIMNALGEADATVDVALDVLNANAIVMPHSALQPFMDLDSGDSDDETEAGGDLTISVAKRKSLPHYPRSQYPSMIKDQTSLEFKRRRFAATELIKSYGFGPRQFDLVVDRFPDILGKRYHKYNPLVPGDWRYCDYPHFARQYVAKSSLAKSRSVSTGKYSLLETYYAPGECLFVDAKNLRARTRLGNTHTFLAADLICGFWIDYHVKNLTKETVVALIVFLESQIKARFGIQLKLILWDHFSSFLSSLVRNFANNLTVQLGCLPAYMKNQNRVEQEIGTLTNMLKFSLEATNSMKVKGKSIKPQDIVDFAISNAVNHRNNLISQTAFRNTGQVATFLEHMSAGRPEKIVEIYGFGTEVVFTPYVDTEYSGANQFAYYLTSAHYCPLKHNQGGASGGVREPTNHLLLVASTGKVVNTGKFDFLTRNQYGQHYAETQPNAPLVSQPRRARSVTSEPLSSDSDDDSGSDAPVHDVTNGRKVDTGLFNEDDQQFEFQAPTGPTQDDDPGHLSDLESDDDMDRHGRPKSQHSDNSDSEDAPEPVIDLSDRSDDEDDIGPRRSTRTRSAPEVYSDDQAVPDSQWHSNIQAMIAHGFKSTTVLMTLTTLFSPLIWFQQGLVQSIETYDAARHEDAFLHQLACGQSVTDPLFDRDNYNVDAMLDMYGRQAKFDEDIATCYQVAADAIWMVNSGHAEWKSNQKSDSSKPTASQYYAVKHGFLRCKRNPDVHEFGKHTDLDDTLLEVFRTYGFQRRSDEQRSSAGGASLKKVEILLQVEGDLNPLHNEQLLKFGDIEFTASKLADLQKEDEDQRDQYYKAICSEMSSLCALGFAAVTIVPDDRDPISTRFVLKVKRKADGEYWKHKARFVVRGFMQRIGLDFYSTFSPMATLNSCRLVLATAVKRKLKCRHIDVPNAFIQSVAERDLYVELPPGLALKAAIAADVQNKAQGKGRVGLRLLKALYGLKQAPLLWNLRIDKFFKGLGLVRQSADACMYKFVENGKFVLLTVSVDDILLTGDHDDKIASITQAIIDEFSIEIDGEMKLPDITENVESFLGVLVKGSSEDGFVSLSCPHKIEEMISEVNSLIKGDIHSQKYLTELNEKSLPTMSQQLREVLKKEYSHFVGKCIYMSITCRPDIATQVSKAARGMHDPQEIHLQLMFQLLKYLNGTKERAVEYRSADSPVTKMLDDYKEDVGKEVKSEIDASPCVAFSDANWADSSDPRLRSTSGYCVYVFGCLISWSTKRQTLTAASTMQAELIAAATCADEVKWFYNILSVNEEIFGAIQAIPLFVDNSAALAVSNHPKMTPQSKFISLREFRIRDYQQEGILRPLWIPTKLNVADGFTKSLGKTQYQQFAHLLGMSPMSNDKHVADNVSCIMRGVKYGSYDVHASRPDGVYFFYCDGYV